MARALGLAPLSGSRPAASTVRSWRGRPAASVSGPNWPVCWLKAGRGTRDTHPRDVPGLVEFRLLRGADTESRTLFSSHAVWSSRKAFEAWTQSEAFREAHGNAGEHRRMYLDRPHFEGFDVVQHIKEPGGHIPEVTQRPVAEALHARDCLEVVQRRIRELSVQMPRSCDFWRTRDILVPSGPAS